VTAVVIDFETTDLLKDGVTDFLAQPGICQVGAMRIRSTMDGLYCDDEFQSLVNPEIAKWADGAMKVHGLTPEKIVSAPTFFELFPKLAEFVLGCDTWVGYNNPFDVDVLKFQLQRYGFDTSFPWPPKQVDVMTIASKRLNGMGKRGQKRWKLVDAYQEVFGVGFEGAHDAMNDVRATGKLYVKWCG